MLALKALSRWPCVPRQFFFEEQGIDLGPEATAIWDVSYAYSRREVTPTEQHVHSFLEMLPLMGLLIIVTLHWQQFLSLFGLGQETADFTLRLRQPPLPWLYVSTILFAGRAL